MAPHNVFDFVSNVANEVAQRLPQALESLPPSLRDENVPRTLDVTCITDRILATSKPAEAPIPTRNDTGRDSTTKGKTQSNLSSNNAANASLIPQQDASDAGSQQQQIHQDEANQPQHISSMKPKAGVNPGTLSTFLTKRHGMKFLCFNLSEELPDDRTLLLLNRQILTCGWSSPCINKSETPCLPHILDVCYAMHAFLSLDPKNVVVVYCANGRTRTAIVVAAFLKLSRVVTTSLEGFRLFLSKRCPHLDPNATLDNIPPSLVTFFRNFDNCLQLGTVMNPKPLLLRAVAVQGVPVDDKPCIDIWDSKQQHVYASYDDDTLSQWADEEGFYRIDRVLEGDFVLLCRFGGPYMDETNDPSTVLFRYANTTGFLASGPYELPKSKVDMMRRYVQSFDEEDFSLTLLMESYWDCTDDEHKEQLEQECDDTVMPPVLQGRDAKEKGWHLITKKHAARPVSQDVKALTRAFPELQECPPHICKLALQLTNFNLMAARDMLLTGSMKSWWRDEPAGHLEQSVEMEAENEPLSREERPPRDEPTRVVTPVPDPRCLDILSILDEVEGLGTSQSQSDNVARKRTAAKSSLQKAPRDEPVPLYQGIQFPNRGDIVNAFGDYYKQIHAQSGQQPRRVQPRRPLELGCKPRMPLIPRKRIRPQNDEDGAKKRPSVDPFGQIGGFPNPGGANGDLVYDEDFMAAMEIYQQINHTGVSLQDLRQAQAASRGWNNVDEPPTEQVESKEKRRKRSPTETAVGSQNAEEGLGGVGFPGERKSTDPLPSSAGEGVSVGGGEDVPVCGEGMPGGGGGATGETVAISTQAIPTAAEGGAANANATTSTASTSAQGETNGNGTGSMKGPPTVAENDTTKGNTATKGNDAATEEKSDSTDGVPLKLDPEYTKV